MLKTTLVLFITFLLSSAGSLAFATDKSQAPLWDSKKKKNTTFPIYKTVVVCGGEYGYMCRRFEEPMGNMKTQKIIYLDENNKAIEKDIWEENLFLTTSTFTSPDGFENDLPKNKIMAEKYFEFLNSRPTVNAYRKRMKLN